MIGFAAFLIGALIGGLRARRAQGNRLDIAQWAFVTGIAFWLATLLVSTLLIRMGWV